MIDGRTF